MRADRRPGRDAVAAHVVLGDVSSGVLELESGDAHHLASALRLRTGEPVGATDGRGRYLRCRYEGKAGLSPDGEVEVSPPRSPVVTVGFAPVKGDRPEWAVQKLTELGVDRIVLLTADRSVVRWSGDRAASHLGRLRAVARQAVMQSRQVWLPEVAGVMSYGAVLSGSTDVAVAHQGGPPIFAGVRTVLIGPEGGWSPGELDAAAATIGLGPTVLRSETAAVAAGVLLTALRSGIVKTAAAG